MKMLHSGRIPLLAVLGLLCTGRVAAAPIDAGAFICVLSEDGRPIPGAVVILDGVLSRRSAATRADGCTLFSPLAPGIWDVTAEAPDHSTRIRIGLRLDPAEVSRLELELPLGDEIISDTDDRVLPDLAARRPLTRTRESLARRPGDSGLDAVLPELSTPSPSWISSYPLTIEDPRTYSGVLPQARRVRMEGARLDGVLNGLSSLKWLDPVAIGGIVAEDVEGVPSIELLPIPPVRSSGGISLAISDDSLQSSGAAALEEYTQLRARFGTPLLADHAALDASWSRSSGTVATAEAREDRVVEGWHLRSVGRWGDRQTSRLLFLGGREQRRNIADAGISRGTETRVTGAGHEYFRPLWSVALSGELLRSTGEEGAARQEEDATGARLQLVRILATRGSDHEFHLIVEERENQVDGEERGTLAAEIQDRWIAGRVTADLSVRWSRRELASSEASSLDPRLDVAARVNENGGTVVLVSVGSRAFDAIDLTTSEVDETLRFGSLRVTQQLGEWTVGEVGVGYSQQRLERSDGVRSQRGWLSVRRRYSSGYAVRGYARWGEFERSPLAGLQSEWAAGGELTVELPTGWGMAVAGEVRDQALTENEEILGNVDIRLSRGIAVADNVRMGLWSEVRNALNAEGLAYVGHDEMPGVRQPRTLVVGASLEF